MKHEPMATANATASAADLGSFVLGLITSVATSWGVGYIFAVSYNYFVKKMQ